MKVLARQLAVAVLGWFMAAPAFALINGEVMVGKRWAERSNEGDHFKAGAVEKSIGVMLDPIPLVPVSFGLIYSMPEWSKDDFRASSSVDAKELDASVRAWLPIGDFMPYARLNYTLTGSINHKANVNNQDLKYEESLTGTHLNVGVEYDLFGPVNILFEVGLGMQQIETKEYRINGVKTDVSSKKDDWKSRSVLLGISAGI